MLRSAFAKIDWGKVIPFFLFLILAFIFWLLIFFQNEEEGNFIIPLKYVNMPEQEVFVNPVPTHINLRMRDKGFDLFLQYFKGRDSLAIDVKEAQKNNDTKLNANQLEQIIYAKLSGNPKMISFVPTSISLKTSKLQSKTVPVVFDGEMRTTAGHLVIDSVSIIPNEVEIFGTNEQLQKITQAVTEYSVFENLKATSQLRAKLKAIEGISFKPREVEVYIPIHEFTERQFEIPLTVVDEPEDTDVKFFPSRVRVTFAVTLEDYKKISPEDFAIEMNYSHLRNMEGDKIELKLSKFPAFIKNPHISPSVIEFLFEQK